MESDPFVAPLVDYAGLDANVSADERRARVLVAPMSPVYLMVVCALLLAIVASDCLPSGVGLSSTGLIVSCAPSTRSGRPSSRLPRAAYAWHVLAWHVCVRNCARTVRTHVATRGVGTLAIVLAR